MQGKILYLSSWQCPGGQIPDFGQIKEAGYIGVIIKPSQGTGYVNKFFKPCADAALAEGLLIGASPYAQPTLNDAGSEAALCLNVIAGYDLELGLWLDWDDPEPLAGMEAADWCQAWFTAVTGRTPLLGIYIDENQLSRVPGVPWGHRLWAADNLSNPPAKPFIQFLEETTVPGVQGLVCVELVTNIRGLNPAGGGPIPYIGKVYNMNELTMGDSGQQVKVLQHYLTEAGHTLVIDGEFGPLTKDAVAAYQGAKGLAVDGIVGPITWGALLG